MHTGVATPDTPMGNGNSDGGSNGASTVFRVTDDRATSMAVVDAVAAVSDLPSAEESPDGDPDGETLPPLYETIDPDALDAVFDRSATGPGAATTLAFTYAGYDVRIDADGVTTITVGE